MNPYDFVRVAWDQPGQRRMAPRCDRFEDLSGRFEGTVTALTPVLIAADHGRDMLTFQQDQHRRHIIPGASLKGLFRSLVETLDGGTWWFFGGENRGEWRDRDTQSGSVNYSDNLPDEFKRPSNRDELDAACRLFGFLSRDSLAAGSVGFDDAICEAPVTHSPFYTCALSGPKPRHNVWYLDDDQNRVRGRKFYFHSTQLQTVRGWLPRQDIEPHRRQNAYIQPVGAGSVFTFRGQFTNVTADDLALLLYAIVLEPVMRHKVGYAKPAGLGSVEIKLNRLEMIDYHARYRSPKDKGMTRYEGQALNAYIEQAIQPFTTNRTSTTLQDLRRIWQWPPVHQVVYPDQNWFQGHRTTPLHDSP